MYRGLAELSLAQNDNVTAMEYIEQGLKKVPRKERAALYWLRANIQIDDGNDAEIPQTIAGTSLYIRKARSGNWWCLEEIERDRSIFFDSSQSSLGRKFRPAKPPFVASWSFSLA